MSHFNRHRGFTLVELLLAMGFVSALLLAIAMTVIQIGNIYNRGITYKNVNQAGSAIASDLQRSINGTSPFDLNVDAFGNGAHRVVRTYGGRLCTNQYTYIWNYGTAINPSALNPSRNKYIGSTNEIRFVKVIDPNSSYCTSPSSAIDSASAVELLDKGQYDLAIHNFIITTDPLANDVNTHQRMYSVEFVLGTNDQLALNSSQTACKSPNQTGSDPTYCSINRFNISARAGNVSENL